MCHKERFGTFDAVGFQRRFRTRLKHRLEGTPVHGRRPLVLCIDKESGRAGHKALLERHGYEVLAVTSDRESLSVLTNTPVDAIVLDLEVPGTSGGAVVRRLKDIKPHIPVLLIDPSASISFGRLPAADAVVLKKEVPVRLLAALDNLLNVRFPFFARWFGNWKYRAGT
jgi:CheY-like chemotaxis protein